MPDDKTYSFPYEKWFRANLTMIASVTPDPGVDFPDGITSDVSITSLDLSKNMLTSVPGEFRQLRNLVTLNLCDNR